jgi:hypothetical protein
MPSAPVAHAKGLNFAGGFAMARYFFQAQYRGATLTDDLGEEFATLREAQGHATVVAYELGRNSVENQTITVFVLSEHGELLARGGAVSN